MILQLKVWKKKNKMLEKLFTSKNRVKILGFLLFEKSETHIREISKILNISSGGVKKEVDNLKELNILEKEKRIKLNKNCSFLEDLRNIFIKTDFITYPIKKTLKNIDAEFIFIFGSFARGEFNSKSDVDLMIIGDVKSMEVYKKTREIEKEINREINPIILKIEDLKKQKNSGFIKDIFKKGIIMVKGEKNELQKIVRWKENRESWGNWI